MDFIKPWFELARDFRTGQFWWSLALLAFFADGYLLLRFNVGLIDWFKELAALSKVEFSGSRGVEIAYFVAAAAATWFYLLPLVLVPLWQKAMFELNLRLFPDYRNTPSSQTGWHYLPGVQQRAALMNNAVLYKHCAARQREITERRHQLTCLLGIVLFCALAIYADITGSSLAGIALAAWKGLSLGWQFLLCVVLLPAVMVLWIILSVQSSRFDSYIQLQEYDPDE